MGEEELRQVIETCVNAHGAHVIDIVVRGPHHSPIVEIYMDAERGVTSEMCADVSREVALAPGVGEFSRLEVSSPGIDRPLRYLWQYAKHIGRPLTVKRHGVEGDELYAGTLKGLESDSVVLEVGKEGERVLIPFREVLEAKVKAPW